MPSLSGQIKAPALRMFYRRWRVALIERAGLPHIDVFEAGELEPMSFAVAIEPGGFRFIRFGPRLADWLGESLEGRLIGDNAPERFGSLAAAYRACAEHQTPTYESIRYAFGDGDTVVRTGGGAFLRCRPDRVASRRRDHDRRHGRDRLNDGDI